MENQEKQAETFLKSQLDEMIWIAWKAHFSFSARSIVEREENKFERREQRNKRKLYFEKVFSVAMRKLKKCFGLKSLFLSKKMKQINV